MSDTKQPFYKSKAFWTLVSSVVAALAAFFLASCAAQARVQRNGVHIDTVRIDYIIRSNNLTRTQYGHSCYCRHLGFLRSRSW